VGNFGGFTSASRRLVTLPDGRRVFAKGATNDLTETWLRAEHHVYTHLHGSFIPQLLGWDLLRGPGRLAGHPRRSPRPFDPARPA
jgi:hypothetical protein